MDWNRVRYHSAFNYNILIQSDYQLVVYCVNWANVKVVYFHCLTSCNTFFCSLALCLVVRAFQEYVEPEEGTPSSPQRRSAPAVGDDESVVLPLGENVFTNNLGIPILVVCTKVQSLQLNFSNNLY